MDTLSIFSWAEYPSILNLVDPVSCRKTIKRLDVPWVIWLDSATQGCNHHDIDGWFGGEACNMIGDLVGIKQAQEQRARVGVLHKDNQAGAVRVINRVCVGRDTIDCQGWVRHLQGVNHDDAAVGLEGDRVAEQIGGPGITNVLLFHICDDGVIVGRNNRAIGRLKIIIGIR